MPAFKGLAWQDQVDVVNMVENLTAVDRVANRSRGAVSWAESPGRNRCSPAALQRILAQEQAARHATP